MNGNNASPVKPQAYNTTGFHLAGYMTRKPPIPEPADGQSVVVNISGCGRVMVRDDKRAHQAGYLHKQRWFDHTSYGVHPGMRWQEILEDKYEAIYTVGPRLDQHQDEVSQIHDDLDIT